MKKNIDDLLIELRSQLASCQGQMEGLATRINNITGEIRGVERVRELLGMGNGVAQLTLMPKPPRMRRPPLDAGTGTVTWKELQDKANSDTAATEPDKPPQQRRSKIERAIVAAFQASANAPLTSHQMAIAANVSVPSASRFISKAVTRGLLVKRGGRYRLLAQEEPT